MSNSCGRIADEVKACIMLSPCWFSGRTFGECMKEKDPEEMPLRCQNLLTLHFECRRGQLDMRNRFRGNHFGAELHVSDDHLDSAADLRRVRPESDGPSGSGSGAAPAAAAGVVGAARVANSASKTAPGDAKKQ